MQLFYLADSPDEVPEVTKFIQKMPRAGLKFRYFQREKLYYYSFKNIFLYFPWNEEAEA